MSTPPRQTGSSLLLLSELYRPWVGGSVRWVDKIGQHWPGPARVVCGLTPGGSMQPTPADGDVPVRRIRLHLRDWGLDAIPGALQYVAAVARLAGQCRRDSRPDLVLCGRGVPEAFIARLAGMITGVRYGTLVHGEEVVACESSGQLRRMLRWAYGGASVVVCNSQNSADLARRAGARPETILISHPGVEVSQWQAAVAREPSDATDGVTLITVGRFDERKNHAGVLRALRTLRDQGLDLRYLVAGVGPMAGALQRLSAELGLEGAVTWLIGASDEKVQEAYRQADIFVMPAFATGTDIEGFGIVYLEAALAGVPSVAGADGGCKEAVLHEQTGLVVDGRDNAALAAAIRELATRASKRRRLALAARERAVRQFDWPVLIEDLARRIQAKLARQANR